jgi:ABC-type dipeptide/oligopeptide/nickel transport system permease component
MLGYIASRVLQLLVTLLVITVLVFAMLRSIPGDPAMVIAGTEATPELVARIREGLGLERPLAVQLARYLGDVLTGDLGRSIRTGAPVTAEMYPRFVATLQLTLASLLVAVLGGTLVGVAAALHRGRLADTAILIGSLAGTSVPSFWVGLVLMIYIGFQANLLPIAGYDSALHLVLPALTVAVGGMPMIIRLVRAALMETLEEDYVRTARAKGLRERAVVMKHALRNALVPVVTVVGLELGRLLGGVVVVESVFAWPGLGRMLLEAIQARDFPVVQGSVLLFSVFLILTNFAIDLCYGVIDPRIRHHAR